MPLIVLQVVGALSVLAFPLFAVVFMIAAPKGSPMKALPYLAVLLYPVVWIGLWVFSWRLFRRGEFLFAHVVSAVPILLSVVMILVVVSLPRKPL